MSTDTVLAEADAEAPLPRRSPAAQDPGRLARALRRDLFGVRFGVLLLIFPMFVVTMWMQVSDRHDWNHPPDSRYYLPMISMDMGHSLGESVKLEQQVSPWTVAPFYFADNDGTWQMVRTRVMYPVLSVPFVYALGLSAGSLVLPIFGDVLFLWVVARVLQRLYGPAVALAVTGMFSFVQPIWGFSWAGTDSLAMGFAAVIVANLPIDRRIGRANLVWLGAFTLFIAMTRQVGVLAPAMAGAGWLWALVRERSWRNRWTGAFAVTSIVTVIVTALSMTLAKADTAGVIGRGQTTYWGIFRQFVHYLKVVTKQATTYMWHDDRILYALLIAAGITVVLKFASDAAAVFVGAVGATYVITAGVGFSSLMRYEMIMFPAAAVAAGSLVWLVLGDRSGTAFAPAPSTARSATSRSAASRAAQADASAAPGRVGVLTGAVSTVAASAGTAVGRAWSGLTAASSRGWETVSGTPVGRWLGLDLPRPDRWKPQLLATSAAVLVVVAVSAAGSWAGGAAAPASPSYAAAQGGHDYAVTPLAKPPAEVTLKAAFVQGELAAQRRSGLQGAFDWVHQIRYRPLSPDEPGWAKRGADGTTVTQASVTDQDQTALVGFGNGITLNQTVVADTLKIVERQTSAYGEDVVFTIKDKNGAVHRGTATTLYPIWDPKGTGFVTALVFDPS